MKFLIDAQLPVGLKIVLEELRCDSLHVISLPNKDKSSDLEVRTIADTQGRIVISKDFDFYYSHTGLGSPQRLLLITTGNIKNKNLFDLFKLNFNRVQIAFKSCSLVEMSNSEVIGIE